MKKIMILILIAFWGFGLNAQSLPIISHSPVNLRGEFIYPLDYYRIVFEPQLQLIDGYKAQVLLDNEIIVESSNFEISNYDTGRVEEGDLVMRFDGRLLPLGHTYTLRLKAGSVADLKNPEIVNEELNLPLVVPANLNHYFRLDSREIKISGDSSKVLDGCIVWIGTEVDPIDSPMVSLRRNGETIGEYSATIRMHDWDLSAVYVNLPAVTLDEGAEYTLVLPANSCCSQFRSDLTNDELTIMIQEASSGIGEVEQDAAAHELLYDLMGRRVVNPAKGVYLKAGKKILIR